MGNCKSELEDRKDCGPSTGCEMTDRLMSLSQEAWEELVIEKMKEHFEKSMGAKLDAAAAAGVAASMECQKSMMLEKEKLREHKEKIRKALTG